MSFEDVIRDLKTIFHDGWWDIPVLADRPYFNEVQVAVWAGHTSAQREDFYDHVALWLAQGFQAAELSYDFCDAVVNNLHGVIIEVEDARPSLFWSVYLAFDEGEYCHPSDPESVDPVERYTRPMLEEILRDHAANGNAIK